MTTSPDANNSMNSSKHKNQSRSRDELISKSVESMSSRRKSFDGNQNQTSTKVIDLSYTNEIKGQDEDKERPSEEETSCV